MLIESQGCCADGDSTILHKDVLDQASADHNAKEEEVIEKAMEDVVFLHSKFPSIDLIENLHKHKSVEDQRVMLCLFCGCESASDGINDVKRHILIICVTEKAPSSEKKNK